ncbi:hypothetical protein [Pontibacter liquoris]|uniref:hypothetical protein n=1 Tax=Pontibacter liquoris TaxID=2905677 RepID=UPI001FA7FD3B|nr:hypothetical protein [Pontibacter liquoris]
MKTLNAILNVVVLAYVVLAILLLTTAVKESDLFDITTPQQVLSFYKILLAVGGGIMLTKLLVNSLYISGIRYEQHQAQLKINELKADLYEKRQEFRSNSYKQARATEAEAA